MQRWFIVSGTKVDGFISGAPLCNSVAPGTNVVFGVKDGNPKSQQGVTNMGE